MNLGVFMVKSHTTSNIAKRNILIGMNRNKDVTKQSLHNTVIDV